MLGFGDRASRLAWRAPGRRVAALTLAALALGALPQPARAWDPLVKMCLPDVINRPNSSGFAPTMDGNIDGDNGWTSAWRYVHMSGTVQNYVTLQSLKDGSFLYFSFDVNRLTGFSSSDFLQVVIDPGGGTLHRYMLFPTNTAGSATPTTLQHSTKVGMAAWASVPGDVGGATVGIQPIAGTENTWRVEIRIPRGAPVNVPATFGLYINTTLTYATATEYVWPDRTSNWLLGDPDNTPPTSGFGTAQLTGAPCNGVFIQPGDISTSNAIPWRIALTGVNTFNGLAHNAMTDNMGNPIAADRVYATFKIANFGISAAWANVPWTGAKPNPTARVTIPAGGTFNFQSTWTLTPAESTAYDTDSTRHQCILVDLNADSSASGGTVVFSNRSAWTNMMFGPASNFDGHAVIDARGFGRMAAKGPVQHFDLFVKTMSGRMLERAYPKTREVLTDQKIMSMSRQMTGERGRVVTRYLQIVHGCLRSGRYIRIHNINYEICGSAGSYGYLVGHVGNAEAGFVHSLRPASRRTVMRETPYAKGFVQVAVPSAGGVDLVSHIETTALQRPGNIPGRVPMPPVKRD